MSFRLRVKYFLIHRLNYTNKTAAALISSGKLTVNGKVITENEVLNDEDELKLDGEILKSIPEYKYYALHKPPGIESTFSTDIKDNLSTVFPFTGEFIVAGRLDKASEGLLIISNNGRWVNSITRPQHKKEKEYIVEVDQEINEEFITKMGQGLDIGICVTLPCFIEKIDLKSFRIILTEGKNKQIRRMCKTLGFRVQTLKRIRIDKFHLSDLKPLNYMEIKI
ncbi:MAG: rRNA pseudouridine synthase [Sphingobacteriaceae bacterium]|nr:rRNA pseudouridine synthase [Sphingobacteriaceae bacterium]